MADPPCSDLPYEEQQYWDRNRRCSWERCSMGLASLCGGEVR